MTESYTKNNAKFSLEDFIPFASFGRPHGLKGAFFLKTADRRKKWDGYKLLLIETSNGFKEVSVKRHYLSGDALVLEIETIHSRSEVEALYNKKIYVHKNLIQLNQDEYLVHDLLNYNVVCSQKGILGKVIGVISYGAQENLEIKLSISNDIVLYPFIDKFIKKIDNEKKEIEVEYIEEFLNGSKA
jgi:16S rRNA processing protein RimM